MVEGQLTPALAVGLERLGWPADDAAVREVVPVAARGSNLVLVLPPTPAWASPVIAGVLGGQAAGTGAVLILAQLAMLEECALAVGALVESSTLQIDVVREVDGVNTGSNPESDVLIASPAGALARHTRSTLRPDRFRAVVFAWPGEWQADQAVADLLQDFPRDAQRVVLTAHPDQIDGSNGVVERYARKALILGDTGVDTVAHVTQPAASVRTVPSPWVRRALTAAGVMQAINPSKATIWTADTRDHQLIRRTFGSMRAGVEIVCRTAPPSGLVVCYDLPNPAQLAALCRAGDVVLLVAPGTEAYVARIAPTCRPLQLASPVAAALDRDASLRREIVAAIEQRDDAAGLYALAPLFERFDPQIVAAALFRLWRSSATTPVGDRVPVAESNRQPPVDPTRASGTAKLWIGAGKKDEATVGDFVAVLIREAGVERSRIGRIELRDTFALVEVPADEAETIAQRLVGVTIRKRKLSARVDRGPGRGAQR